MSQWDCEGQGVPPRGTSHFWMSSVWEDEIGFYERPGDMLLLGMLNILKLWMCSHPMMQALKERPGPLRVGYFMPQPVCLRAHICSYSLSIVPVERAWKTFPQRVYGKACNFVISWGSQGHCLSPLGKSLPVRPGVLFDAQNSICTAA